MYFLFVCICEEMFICMCTICVQVPAEATQGCWISWRWVYLLFVLGNKPRFPARAAGALNYRAISPA